MKDSGESFEPEAFTVAVVSTLLLVGWIMTGEVLLLVLAFVGALASHWLFR
jgi:hypothetical protein